MNFNPRSPCGERRYEEGKDGVSMDISIHAPRVGSDLNQTAAPSTDFYFNPRSPCGERRHRTRQAVWRDVFQSTLPVWGAT